MDQNKKSFEVYESTIPTLIKSIGSSSVFNVNKVNTPE